MVNSIRGAQIKVLESHRASVKIEKLALRCAYCDRRSKLSTQVIVLIQQLTG
jgi:hypothetical protein